MKKNTILQNKLADHDIERFIGLQLRVGVLLSSFIVLMGGLLYLYQLGGVPMPSYHTFAGEKTGITSFTSVLHGAVSLDARAIIQLGVVILVATPVFRIALSLVGFLLDGDKMYTLITLVVLAIMLFSVFGGLKI
ncbi:DUF1634 domain-containing protein [Mucilaginibacter gynuensis]